MIGMTDNVRVPNVSPGAVSGLDHEPLGSHPTDNPGVDLDATEGTDDGVIGLEVDLPEEVTGTEPDDASGSTDGTIPDAADQDTEGTDDGTVPGVVVGADGSETPGDTLDVIDVDSYHVDDLNDYLDEHPDQIQAALAAEAEGQARKGILHGRHGDPAAD